MNYHLGHGKKAYYVFEKFYKVIHIFTVLFKVCFVSKDGVLYVENISAFYLIYSREEINFATCLKLSWNIR